LNRALALQPSELVALRGQVITGRAALRPADAQRAATRPYAIAAGVAVVPVFGILTHGQAWGWSDETSYDSIRRGMAHAVQNSDVRAIALHINSPGGDCAGCFDLADAIYAMRGAKPIWAILDENACSAAYAVASAADMVTVPRTGLIGSIGIIVLHTDFSGMLDQAGVKITTITFGAQKADGLPTAPLSPGARKRVQAQIDALGEMFVAQVARNRGMSRVRVRDTEAAVFLGADGVRAGLADEVLSPDEAFLALLGSLPSAPAGRSARRPV
jgi:signal peptide peptidase SppA